jgi:hypothetical protein
MAAADAAIRETRISLDRIRKTGRPEADPESDREDSA